MTTERLHEQHISLLYQQQARIEQRARQLLRDTDAMTPALHCFGRCHLPAAHLHALSVTPDAGLLPVARAVRAALRTHLNGSAMALAEQQLFGVQQNEPPHAYCDHCPCRP